VLRSDIYGLGKDFVLDLDGNGVPYVELDPEFFKFVSDFDKRFPEGAPSLKDATSFTVDGDWTFGHGVSVEGAVSLDRPKTAQRVAPGTVLGADD
jgi:UTP--glucose-1-phosphate uridylyltransferase